MNTATATQRLQTTCLLSLAMLISLTSDGAHVPSDPGGDRAESRASPSCTDGREPMGIIVSYAAAPSCNTLTEFGTITPPPVRLVSPVPGSRYLFPDDNIRYAF